MARQQDPDFEDPIEYGETEEVETPEDEAPLWE